MVEGKGCTDGTLSDSHYELERISRGNGGTAQKPRHARAYVDIFVYALSLNVYVTIFCDNGCIKYSYILHFANTH